MEISALVTGGLSILGLFYQWMKKHNINECNICGFRIVRVQNNNNNPFNDPMSPSQEIEITVV